jgi:hypothetical protein
MRHFHCFSIWSRAATWSTAITALIVAMCSQTVLAGEPPYDMVWALQSGTSGTDVAYAARASDAGSTVVCGYTTGDFGGANAGFKDIFTAKYSLEGDLLWVWQNGTGADDEARAVAVGSDGSVHVTGDIGVGVDGFIAKCSSAGELLWIRQIDSTSYDHARAVALDAEGNVFVCGHTRGSFSGPNFGGFDAWVAKYSPSGDLDWMRQIGTSGTEYGLALAIGIEGDVFLGGEIRFGSLGDPYLGGTDAYVAKFSARGDLQWTRQFGTSASESTHSVVVDSNDHVIAAGVTTGDLASKSAGGDDLFLAKFSTAGDPLWVQQTGTSNHDRCYSAALDASGNIFVSGLVSHIPAVTQIDALLTKFSANGNPLWTRYISTTALDISYGVTVDAEHDVIVAGVTGGELGGPFLGGNGDVFLAKFAPDSSSLGDITGDGSVNADDVLAVIVDWGNCPTPPNDCPADIAPHPIGNEAVDSDDLIMVIVNWDE